MAILNAKRCSLFFLLLVVLELALVSEHIKPVQAGKKKKLLKKLKDILPLLALLKVLSQILSFFSFTYLFDTAAVKVAVNN